MTAGPNADPGHTTATGPAARLSSVSLRLRATIAVVIVVVAVLIGLGVVVDRTFSAQAERSATNLLTGRAQLARQLARGGPKPQQLVNRVDARGVRASLELRNGTVFGSAPPNQPQAVTTRTVLNGPGQIDRSVLTLTLDTALIDDARANLRRSLVITGLAALIVAALLVTLVMRYSLRPLDAFAGLAREIIEGRRGRRLSPARTNTELGRAAAAVDGMLDALEGAERRALLAEGDARNAAQRSQIFLADAAHELRTPIAGVQAAAETLLHQGSAATETEREQLLVLLVREAQRAGRLTDDLLTAARLDSGVSVQISQLDLAELLRAEGERTALLQPGMRISVSSKPAMIESDPAKIKSIIGNLISNAVRAAGPTGTITINARRSAGRIQIAVADDGPGIPADQRERIFERLVRLDPSRSRDAHAESSGSGLGLAISRGYARALGGELTAVDPTPPMRGATFLLVLPG